MPSPWLSPHLCAPCEGWKAKAWKGCQVVAPRLTCCGRRVSHGGNMGNSRYPKEKSKKYQNMDIQIMVSNQIAVYS